MIFVFIIFKLQNRNLAPFSSQAKYTLHYFLHMIVNLYHIFNLLCSLDWYILVLN